MGNWGMEIMCMLLIASEMLHASLHFQDPRGCLQLLYEVPECASHYLPLQDVSDSMQNASYGHLLQLCITAVTIIAIK